LVQFASHVAAIAAAVGMTIAPAAFAAPVKILAFGDSLTAGYGLPETDAFPAKLEAALKARGHDVVIVNSGVSGDTASDGAARLDWSLTEDIGAVIVELGANDALRGIDPAITRDALDRILTGLANRNLPVLLAGMYAPRNLGEQYVDAFDRIYPDLATEHGALLYPFFLDGVVGQASLNQGDGLHPTAAGIDVIVERILPSVEKLIAEVAPAAGPAP
jgi:acyl-CoA thioesterase-1